MDCGPQIRVAGFGDRLKDAVCILGIRFVMLAWSAVINCRAVVRSFMLVKEVMDLVGG